MKKLFFSILIAYLLSFGASYCTAQKDTYNGFGRIVLNTYLSPTLNIPDEAKEQLRNKINFITSTNGIGGSQNNPKFIITANLSVISKDIVPGPPQMITQKIDITFYIGDGIEKKLFNSSTSSVIGVGMNENKSFIDAINKIDPNSIKLVNFIAESKKKIIEYYSATCDFIIRDANSKANQSKWDEAIYNLAAVPDACEPCYNRCLDSISVYYRNKIDADGIQKLNQAKKIWVSNQNYQGADQAGKVLISINSNASCQSEVKTLFRSMNEKIQENEKMQFELTLKEYEAAQEEAKRNFELDKLRIDAYRQVASEYAKNQPRYMIYYDVIWW